MPVTIFMFLMFVFCCLFCCFLFLDFLTCFISSQETQRRPSKVVDVTVPVQCQVKDSRLFLTESSKVQESRQFKTNSFLTHVAVFCSKEANSSVHFASLKGMKKIKV